MRREIAGACAAILITGCGLVKSGDAPTALPTDSATDDATAAASHGSNSSEKYDYASTLTRSSRNATQLQLTALHGPATGAQLVAMFGSDAAIGDPETAKGLERAVASFERSYSQLAQRWIGDRSITLCDKVVAELQTAAPAKDSMFSADVCATDETEEECPRNQIPLATATPRPSPTSNWTQIEARAERASFLAARNTWRALVSPKGPEVKLLKDMYLDGLRNGGQNERTAQKSVCMAVIQAPQFWIGFPGRGSQVRRIALEVGRRLPTFDEIKFYTDPKNTFRQYVKALQDEAFADLANQGGPGGANVVRRGYLKAVSDWHQEWLGLRTGFVSDTFANYKAAGDFLLGGSFQALHTRVTIGGTGFDEVRHSNFDSQVCDGKRLWTVGSERDWISWPSDFASGTNDVIPREQAFDPRTIMLTWEYQVGSGAGTHYELGGAWVHKNYLSAFRAHLATLGYLQPSEIPATDAALTTSGDWCTFIPAATAGSEFTGLPEYYECKGRVTKTGSYASTDSARLKAVGLADIFTLTPDFANGVYTTRAPTIAGTGFDGTLAEDFRHRRMRRFAPSGEQNGMSRLKLRWSGKEVMVCNSVERFMYSCEFRIPPKFTFLGKALTNGKIYNQGAGDHATWTARSFDPHNIGGGAETPDPDSWANPYILNMFSCGAMSFAQMNTGSAATEATAFPKGYTNYASITDAIGTVPAPSAASLNTLGNRINWGHYPADNPTELQSILKLKHDMLDEPYRLLSHVLTNRQSYYEFFRSTHSYAGRELQTLYSGQANRLPATLTTLIPAANEGPSQGAEYFDFESFPDIKLSALSGKAPNVVYSGYVAPNLNTINRARPTSGILSMPAFLGPVSQSIRTISSRYFTRLLCGDPTIFQPNSAEKAIHRAHMVGQAENGQPLLVIGSGASAKRDLHLDETRGCFACHVNLDPLGAAMSGNFLPALIGAVPDYRAWNGEFDPLGDTLWGVKSGDPANRGTGAFLGREVSGVAEIGETLVHHRLFNRCVALTTFQNVVGRPARSEDVPTIEALTDRFLANPDFNLLVQDIVSSKAFLSEN